MIPLAVHQAAAEGMWLAGLWFLARWYMTAAQRRLLSSSEDS